MGIFFSSRGISLGSASSAGALPRPAIQAVIAPKPFAPEAGVRTRIGLGHGGCCHSNRWIRFPRSAEGRIKARNRTIEDWFAWIRDGHVVLPCFQRFEAWGWWQVEGILENILRRPPLPVGALLTLEVGDEIPFHARPISGAAEPRGRPGYHLLDGQQRLTAF